jgi:excisionase family DNA binding protein
MDEDDLLTAEEVATRLGVKPGWVNTMAARNEIPFVLEGSRWKATSYRFRRSEIDAWMTANEESTNRKLEGS